MKIQLLSNIKKGLILKIIILILISVPLLVSCGNKTQQPSNELVVESNLLIVPDEAQETVKEQSEVEYKEDLEIESEEYNADALLESDYNNDSIIQTNDIERGVVLVNQNKTKYYAFINETYCMLEDDGVTLGLNSYSLTDTLKFPEDVPIMMPLAYKGYVNFMDIQKDDAGNRVEIICIDALSKDSYGKETTQLLAIARYESDIEKKQEYNYVIATGIFNGDMISDNLGNPMPVLWANEVFPGSTICQAIKDEDTSKIFLLDDTSLITLDMSFKPINQFYFLTPQMIKDNTIDYTKHYFNYDYVEGRSYIGLYNKKKKDYNLYVIDEQQGTLEGLEGLVLTEEEKQLAIDDARARIKAKENQKEG